MLYNKQIFKRVFCYKPKYWYKNLKRIPLYFREIHYLVKHGYPSDALWDIQYWFGDTMSRILTEFRDNSQGAPTCEIVKGVKPETEEEWTEQHKRWVEILNQMIILLRESNERTCKCKNPYQDEWDKVYKEFYDKYGLLGEKLLTEKERADYERNGYRTFHHPSELPEYRDIWNKYSKASEEIDKHRELCKNEFFELFSKYYYNLWD